MWQELRNASFWAEMRDVEDIRVTSRTQITAHAILIQI
jgi:hypothetical protein